MRFVKHLEAGDNIYLLKEKTSDISEVIEITLTEEHIKNRDTSEPAFVYRDLYLRLKNTQVLKNDEVRLEKGEFYDRSVGMRTDYGYHFYKTNDKCFASLEAAKEYLKSKNDKSNLLALHYKKTMTAVNKHLDTIEKLLDEHKNFIEDNEIAEEVVQKLDYELFEELHDFIHDEPMFE